MTSERMMGINTEEYKNLVQKSIRADLLWQKCERIKQQTGCATIDIDEVAFILGVSGQEDEFCGLPFVDVPQEKFDLHEDGGN